MGPARDVSGDFFFVLVIFLKFDSYSNFEKIISSLFCPAYVFVKSWILKCNVYGTADEM